MNGLPGFSRSVLASTSGGRYSRSAGARMVALPAILLQAPRAHEKLTLWQVATCRCGRYRAPLGKDDMHGIEHRALLCCSSVLSRGSRAPPCNRISNPTTPAASRVRGAWRHVARASALTRLPAGRTAPAPASPRRNTGILSIVENGVKDNTSAATTAPNGSRQNPAGCHQAPENQSVRSVFHRKLR